ncbi:hypothetical protein BKA66DRAFT_554992 [Pyrenochaeta sp. MPI-SDFR-AT-0127]|nr:hypothetical protein BKA66DRAFT_554992 [Pyrenochaeta sp. MPI-SDFR-AT-0127]
MGRLGTPSSCQAPVCMTPTQPITIRRGIEMAFPPTTPLPDSRSFSAMWDTGEPSQTSSLADSDTNSIVASTDLEDPFLEASFFNQRFQYEEDDDVFPMSPLSPIVDAHQSTPALQPHGFAFPSSPVLPQPPTLLRSPFDKDAVPSEEEVNAATALLQLRRDSRAFYAPGPSHYHGHDQTRAFVPQHADITNYTAHALLALRSMDTVFPDRWASPAPRHDEPNMALRGREFALGGGESGTPSSVFDSWRSTPCLSSISSSASPSASASLDSYMSKAQIQASPNESLADLLLGLRDHLDRIIVAIRASDGESPRCD